MKAAVSGPIRTQEAFEAFNQWFSGYHASLKQELFPRDFMWFNEREQATEWAYVLPASAGEDNCGSYEVKELPFGLYAVAVCRDADLDQAEDWMKTRQEIREWVKESPLFRLHENGSDPEERYDMFHIVSPGWLMKDGISLEDMFVPIHRK